MSQLAIAVGKVQNCKMKKFRGEKKNLSFCQAVCENYFAAKDEKKKKFI